MKPKYLTLKPLLLERQRSLTQRWVDQTLATYPKDAGKFLKGQKNQFANPVGHTLEVGLTSLCEQLIAGFGEDDMGAEQLCAAVEPIVKIRSIQDFTPSQAVSFVFLLKAVVRSELAKELKSPSSDLLLELSSFDHRIDQLALFTFDVFTKCRDRFFEIRVNDVKRRVSGLMRRMHIGLDDLEASPDS